MAYSEVTSGTLTLTTGEQTLGSAQTTAGVYELALDLSTMAAGDIVEVYVYTKARSASTARLLTKASFANAQGEAGYVTPPFGSPHSIEFKAKQPTGTLRTIEYSIRKL
jgi:hypothetical protein